MSYTCAIVYDLPSENQRVFNLEIIKDRVRCARVRCVELLHSLGVQCTESVILIAPSKEAWIEEKIQKVKQIYDELNEYLRDNTVDAYLEPIIQVLRLSEEQTNQLLPIAKRRLLETLDRAIDRVSEILSILRGYVEEHNRRRIAINLRRMRNEWARIYELARELGIDITNDYQWLIELIDRALSEGQ